MYVDSWIDVDQNGPSPSPASTVNMVPSPFLDLDGDGEFYGEHESFLSGPFYSTPDDYEADEEEEEEEEEEEDDGDEEEDEGEYEDQARERENGSGSHRPSSQRTVATSNYDLGISLSTLITPSKGAGGGTTPAFDRYSRYKSSPSSSRREPEELKLLRQVDNKLQHSSSDLTNSTSDSPPVFLSTPIASTFELTAVWVAAGLSLVAGLSFGAGYAFGRRSTGALRVA